MGTCDWPLGNGQALTFNIYDINSKPWNQVPGLYIFAKANGGYWNALYVGQTDNFADRMPRHERLAEAVRKGATHIHAKTIMSASDRDLWEKMLIKNLQPPMNELLR